MTYIWLSLLIGSPFWIYGIVNMVFAFRHKRAIRLCTEAANAKILSMGKRKNRYGYKFIYHVHYSCQGVQFTPSFTTWEFLGEVGENTTIFIDPADHIPFYWHRYHAFVNRCRPGDEGFCLVSEKP